MNQLDQATDSSAWKDIAPEAVQLVSSALKKSEAIPADSEPEPAEIPGGVAAALERRNRDFSPRGRGLLMLREICSSIRLDRYGDLNESVYTIPLADPGPAR